MSILDKASLIQIPSGYKSTKLYSLRPSNGDGDFTFARSSSATRVNSEGLIEVASVLGSEEVTNGDFATDSDWTKGAGWTISGGTANSSGLNSNLQQNSILVIGKKYEIKITVINYVSGTVEVSAGAAPRGQITANGTYTFTQVCTPANNFYVISQSFNGSIDNVSVKEVIENDVPRLDYSGGASCASLLLEPQRTNLATYSSDFSGGWTLDDATKVSNSTTSPDGNTNAITLIGNTNASRHNISQVVSASVTASLSVFAKAKELRYLQIASANTTSQYVNFDVSDGTIGTVGSSFTDAKIEDYGNGWYRCSVTSTNQYYAMYISLVSSLTSSWLESWTMSNNTDGLYLYGAQLEQGSYLTSYIPTTTAAVTRTADVCNNAGTSATFNDSEGVLFFEGSTLVESGITRVISLSDGSTSNNIYFNFNQNANSFNCEVLSGGSGQFNASVTITKINNNKIALKYKANDFALWINGTEVATDTSGSAPSGLDRLNFDFGQGIFDFEGKCKQLMVFNEALSDEELSDLTGQVNLSFNNLATFYGYTIL